MAEEVILPEIPEWSEEEALFLPDDKWQDVDIGPNMLDVTEPYTPPKYTLSWQDVKFAPIGGIHCISGQPGQGKTFTITQIIVAILKGEYMGLKYELDYLQPNPSVLYIDTEQEKENTKLVNLRIYEMMGWTFQEPHTEFRIMFLREEEKAENRWRKVIKAIDTLKPTVAFIDGQLDVLNDFNDNQECGEKVYKEMKMASHYGMSLWIVNHENPNSSKMVGHSGSFLERKVTDQLSPSKTKDENTGDVYFTVKQKKARGKDLMPWKFRITDGEHSFGIPEIEQSSEAPADDTAFDVYNMTPEMLMPIRMMITDRSGITTRDLRELVKQQYRVGAIKADKIIAKAVEQGIITRSENKRYFLNDGTSETEDVPF